MLGESDHFQARNCLLHISQERIKKVKEKFASTVRRDENLDGG